MSPYLSLSFLLLLVGFLQGNPTVRKKGFGPGEQEWGFVDVRPGAHMFYWLFFVQDPKVSSFYERPLVVWLQGGPGGSSSGFGNFEEIGPLFTNGTIRPHSWAKHVNLLFIDNPVGAGFSYVDNKNLLTKTNAEIGKDMVAFLTSFFKKFPKFEKSPFYIYSESYGGKMTVEIAKQLLDAIKNKKVNINFKGVGLGDAWISPIHSVSSWPVLLYLMGLTDYPATLRIVESILKLQDTIEAGKFETATSLWRDIEIQILEETHNVDFYNILYKVRPLYKNDEKELGNGLSPRFGTAELLKLMEGPVKKALGIPSKVVHNSQSRDVFKALSGDFMKPVVEDVQHLLNHSNLQIVVFNGNLDLIVAYSGTYAWLKQMNWKNASQWNDAPSKPLILKGYIEGYVKNAGNLYLYTIHRSGHMVPTDNPEAALEVLRRSTGFDKRMVDESSVY